MNHWFWSVIHNCVAHPLEGIWTLVTVGRKPIPKWIDEFHEWTAKRAWNKLDE